MTRKILPLLLFLPLTVGCWESPSGWESPTTQASTTPEITPSQTLEATPTVVPETDPPATDTPATDTPATPTMTETPSPTPTDVPATPSPEVCLDFIDQDSDGFDNCTSADSLDSVEGESDDSLSAVVSLGDINADGWTDIAIGADDKEVDGVHESGQVAVYLGSQVGLNLNAPPVTFYSNSAEGHAGHPASGGDLNSDGFADLLIAARGETHPDALGTGRVHLICGQEDGLSGDIPLSQDATDATLYLSEAREQLGYAMAGNGDFNGDGIQDIAMSVYQRDGSEGIVYVIYGDESFCLTHQDIELPGGADLVIYNSEADESLGAALAFVSDIDGDGNDELLIGAPGPSPAIEPGKTFLIFGSEAPPVIFDVEVPDGLAMITYADSVTNTRFGDALASGGDLNGDGQDDIAIGAPGIPGEDGLGDGKVFVVTNITRPEGESTTSEIPLPTELSFTLSGQVSGANFGRSIALISDVDKDGNDDLLVGAPGSGNIGQAYLFRPFSDSPELPTVFTGTVSSGAFGSHIAAFTPSLAQENGPTLILVGGLNEGENLGGMVNLYGNLPEDGPPQ